MKIEFEIKENGDIICLLKKAKHKKKFNDNEIRSIREFIIKYHDGIVKKWNRVFIEKLEIQCEEINQI